MAELTRLLHDRKTIRDQIARHPMIAFITLAYAISWIAWFLVYRIDLGAVNGFGVIGGAGPALAAMIASALMKPEPSGVSADKRWRLFGIIGIFVLAVMIIRRLWIGAGLVTVTGRVITSAAYPTFAAFLVDVLAAAVVAFFLSGVHSPRQGVRDFLHSLNFRQQHIRWYWYAIGAALYPGTIALGNAVAVCFGMSVPASRTTGAWYWVALDLVLLFLNVLFGGGGLEEPGWRGLALPLLQKRYTPFRSSLILAVIWAFWHWPMFWFGFYEGGPFGVFFYVLGVAPIAILLTAVFNCTRGSLPVVILLHTSINMTPMFITPTTLATSLWMLLMLGMALWMWRSPQTFSLFQ